MIWLGRAAILLAFLVAWQLASGPMIPKMFVSDPISIGMTIVQWIEDGSLWNHLATSLVRDDDDGLAGKAGRPILDVVVGSAHGAGNQPRVRREIFVDADVDQRRRIRRADQSRQFVE